MPNGMYFLFYDEFAPFDRMLCIVEGKEVNNLQLITPLVITYFSNDWILFAVKEGGVVKKNTIQNLNCIISVKLCYNRN